MFALNQFTPCPLGNGGKQGGLYNIQASICDIKVDILLVGEVVWKKHTRDDYNACLFVVMFALYLFRMFVCVCVCYGLVAAASAEPSLPHITSSIV